MGKTSKWGGICFAAWLLAGCTQPVGDPVADLSGYRFPQACRGEMTCTAESCTLNGRTVMVHSLDENQRRDLGRNLSTQEVVVRSTLTDVYVKDNTVGTERLTAIRMGICTGIVGPYQK